MLLLLSFALRAPPCVTESELRKIQNFQTAASQPAGRRAPVHFSLVPVYIHEKLSTNKINASSYNLWI